MMTRGASAACQTSEERKKEQTVAQSGSRRLSLVNQSGHHEDRRNEKKGVRHCRAARWKEFSLKSALTGRSEDGWKLREAVLSTVPAPLPPLSASLACISADKDTVGKRRPIPKSIYPWSTDDALLSA